MSANQALSLVEKLIALIGDDSIVSEDNFDVLQVRADNVPIPVLIDTLESAADSGATIQVETQISGSSVIVETHDNGWSIQEARGSSYRPEKARYTGSEVASRISSGSVIATFSKSSWGPPWIGWSLGMFARWLDKVGPTTVMEKLLSSSNARIATYTWQDPAIELGASLRLGGLDIESTPSQRLSWPEPQEQALLRAALIDTDDSPSEVQPALRRVAISAGIRILAEQILNNGRERAVLDRRVGSEVLIPPAGDLTIETERWVRALIEWVMADPTNTRLRVARQVAAERADEMISSPNAGALKARLDIAYAAAVDEQTGRALAALASFEKHVMDLTARLHDLARKVDSTVDETIARTLALVLAILVASVIAKDLQGWPLLVAAGGVALYVLWTAVLVLGGVRSDVDRQGTLVGQAFSARPPALAEAGESATDAFVSGISNRVFLRQGFLVLVAVAVGIIGILLYEFAGESNPDSQMESGTEPTAATTPDDASGPGDSVTVPQLTIASIPEDIPSYDRTEWNHWIDEDGDCQDTRQEVLIEESLIEVTFTDARECRVAEGQWIDPYTGTEVTNPSDLHIDHMVPLANAHVSGGWAWDADRKEAYYNFLGYDGHLIAVTASANLSKKSRGPEEWKPPSEAYWCEYAVQWVEVKAEWDLTARAAEWDALLDMLDGCSGVDVSEEPATSP